MNTRQRLTQVAIRLFAAQGFQATGIRDLAKHTGISVASLYQHMSTKEDLLVQIMSDSLRRLTDDADVVLAEVGDPLDRLAGLTTLHVFAHALRRDRTLVVDTEVRSLGPTALEQVVKLRDSYEERWNAVLVTAAAEQLITTGELRLARLAILDMLSGVASWFRPDGPYSIEDLARIHVDLVLAMLDAHRGRHKVRHADCQYPPMEWFAALLGDDE